MVQWLRLRASTAGDAGWIPGWGTKIPHTMRCGQKITTTTKINKYIGGSSGDREFWIKVKMLDFVSSEGITEVVTFE